MAHEIKPLKASETPNAVCSICLLPTRNGGSRVVKATAEVSGRPTIWHAYFVCSFHEERSRLIQRLGL